MKEIGLYAVICIVLVALLGTCGLIYKATIVKKSVDIDRQIFKESKSHVEGMADDLAKYRHEYTTTDNATERKAIKDLIISRFADFDVNNLTDSGLQSFLVQMRGY